MTNFWRRIAEVYELHKIENGQPIGHPLFRWQHGSDSFEKLSDPHQFGRDSGDLERRASLIEGLAREDRTSVEDVRAAVERYRNS
jgi:hypothetical protein